MTLEIINGWHCPSADPYFGPVLRENVFLDGWTLQEALLHTKQRRICLDVGAHIGTWAVPMAAEFASVICFEPDSQNFGALAANTAHLANVKALPVALAPRSGRYSFSHAGTVNSGEGFLAPIGYDDNWVVGLRLDDLQFIDIDLVKIDVEGLEAEVLTNGEQTVRRNRPVIVLEENLRLDGRYGGKAGDARELLTGWGMAEVARREFISGVFDVVLHWPVVSD